MRTRTQLLLAAGVFTLAIVPAGAHAQGQFRVPPNSLALEDTGTLEGMRGNFVHFRDSKKEPWMIQVVRQTSLSIESEADGNYLRPGLTVELTGTVDENGSLTEPVTEIEVLDSKGRRSMGLFDPDDKRATKPVRNPVAGKYRIRGKLVSYKNGELLIAAGRLKIGAEAGEELKVMLNVDDPRNAKVGDEVTIKAWYYNSERPTPNRPGKALAEQVSIILSEPPPGEAAVE